MYIDTLIQIGCIPLLCRLFSLSNEYITKNKVLHVLSNISLTSSSHRDIVLDFFSFGSLIDNSFTSKSVPKFLISLLDFRVSPLRIQSFLPFVFPIFELYKFHFPKQIIHFISHLHRRVSVRYLQDFSIIYQYIVRFLIEHIDSEVSAHITYVMSKAVDDFSCLFAIAAPSLAVLVQRGDSSTVRNSLRVLQRLLSSGAVELSLSTARDLFTISLASSAGAGRAAIDHIAKFVVFIISSLSSETVHSLLLECDVIGFFVDAMISCDDCTRSIILRSVHNIQVQEDALCDGIDIVSYFVSECSDILRLSSSSSNEHLNETSTLFQAYFEQRRKRDE